MKSIVENISREIVAAVDGRTAGIVTNVFVSEKLARVRGYKAADDERDEIGLVPLRRLIGEGDALVVRNLTHIKETALPECPLGAKVYDTAGKLHGVLRDLLFDESSGTVLSLVTDEGEITPERVLSFGKRVVVLRAPEHDKMFFRRSPDRNKPSVREQKPAAEIIPAAPLEQAPTEPSLPAEESVEVDEGESFLFRDYAFLLGRKVVKNLVSGSDLIAMENDLVTPETIVRAHRSGKLVELTVNSRK